MSAPMSFDDQLRLLLAAMDHAEAMIFLAGVRFVSGFEEHGDGMWTMPKAQLAFEQLQEDADSFLYGKALECRGDEA